MQMSYLLCSCIRVVEVFVVVDLYCYFCWLVGWYGFVCLFHFCCYFLFVIVTVVVGCCCCCCWWIQFYIVFICCSCYLLILFSVIKSIS